MVTKKISRKPEQVAHMVFVSEGRIPQYVHESLKSARDEAKRLAEQCPHRLVRVMRVVEQYRGDVMVNSVEITFPEEIPF